MYMYIFVRVCNRCTVYTLLYTYGKIKESVSLTLRSKIVSDLLNLHIVWNLQLRIVVHTKNVSIVTHIREWGSTEKWVIQITDSARPHAGRGCSGYAVLLVLGYGRWQSVSQPVTLTCSLTCCIQEVLSNLFFHSYAI